MDDNRMTTQPEFWQEFEQRGIVQQTTQPKQSGVTLPQWLSQKISSDTSNTVYVGFDPTADSLHIGSLMPVLGLRRLKQAGMKPIALVGGATGCIGDPSGKSAERNLLDEDTLAKNVAGIATQLEQLLDGEAGKDFLMANNADWIAPISLIDFLRDVGKHFSVNMMIQKESVRARLEDRDHGISYTEFSYMLLQAYDFLHLYETMGCQLQVGGSDQWGNIIAGIDLIRHKHHGAEANGFTFPLITTATGQKFGKSEQGTIWIDPKRTHPHTLYKYFFHTADADVIRFLNFFTFLPLAEIASLSESLENEAHLRLAHKRLALEITTIVHGADTALACEGLEIAMHQDDVEAFERYARQLGLLDSKEVENLAHDPSILPVAHKSMTELASGINAMDLAVEIGLFKSKSEVRREIGSANSGFRIAGEQVSDIDFQITPELLGSRRVLQIRRGKKNKRMVCFLENSNS